MIKNMIFSFILLYLINFIQSEPINIHSAVNKLSQDMKSRLLEWKGTSWNYQDILHFNKEFKKSAPLIISKNRNEFKKKSANHHYLLKRSMMLEYVGKTFSDIVRWVSHYHNHPIRKRGISSDPEGGQDVVLNEFDLIKMNERIALQKRLDDLTEHLDYLSALKSTSNEFKRADVETAIKYTHSIIEGVNKRIKSLDLPSRLCKKSGCASFIKTKLNNLAHAPLGTAIKMASVITLGGTALATLYSLFITFFYE